MQLWLFLDVYNYYSKPAAEKDINVIEKIVTSLPEQLLLLTLKTITFGVHLYSEFISSIV